MQAHDSTPRLPALTPSSLWTSSERCVHACTITLPPPPHTLPHLLQHHRFVTVAVVAVVDAGHTSTMCHLHQEALRHLRGCCVPSSRLSTWLAQNAPAKQSQVRPCVREGGSGIEVSTSIVCFCTQQRGIAWRRPSLSIDHWRHWATSSLHWLSALQSMQLVWDKGSVTKHSLPLSFSPLCGVLCRKRRKHGQASSSFVPWRDSKLTRILQVRDLCR